MGRGRSEIESKSHNIYLPVEKVKDAKMYLREEGISFNALMRSLLIGWLEEQDRKVIEREKMRAAREKIREVRGGGW